MVSKIKYLTVATVIALATASSAFAAGVEVGGINQATVGSEVTNLALGSKATARQGVGSIQDVKAGGINQATVANRVTNAAIGAEAAACQTIGSIGAVC